MIYEVTSKNHLKALSFLFITSAMVVVGSFLIGFNFNSLLIGFAAYAIFFIPSLFLHVEYYLKNQGEKIEISENAVVLHRKDGVRIKYEAYELDKIVLYKSASLDKGGIPITPIESYHFARIIPKKAGCEIFVTCLIASDVEGAVRALRGVSFERKKILFSSIRFSSDFI